MTISDRWSSLQRGQGGIKADELFIDLIGFTVPQRRPGHIRVYFHE
jgi:hypothetical protein